MKTDWSKENLEKIIKDCYSVADVLEKQGLKRVGGNYHTAKKYIDLYQLDTSHFTGQLWHSSPIKTFEDKKLVKLEEILQENTSFGSDHLKRRLIEAGLKQYQCECCGNTTWNDNPIPLELHHINHFDNRLENLQLLCCNCHAQTDTYKKRMSERKDTNKIHIVTEPQRLGIYKRIKDKICPICGKKYHPQRNKQKYCSLDCMWEARKQSLGNAGLGVANENLQKENLLKLAENCNTMHELAEKVGTSRPTIRKYLEKYGVLEKFKSKFDFRAKEILQYDLNGNFIKEWPSISDAEQTLGLCDIGKCINFQRKSCGGFIWRLKEI